MTSDTKVMKFNVVAFLCGFNVMLTEMCAFRVLQTHFGSSVFVTGILLTVVLLSMTWGSYLGGTWRIVRSERAVVIGLIVASLYFVFVNSIFRESIVAALSIWTTGYARFIYPAAAAICLYLVPVLILSMLLPIFVHSSQTIPGSLVGKLVASSNLGSILGVVLTTFIFLPLLGLKHTTDISIFTLLLCCWALCPRSMYWKLAFTSAAILGLLIFSQYRQEPLPEGVVLRGQSLYGEYTVRVNKVQGVLRGIGYSSSRIYTHSAYRFGGLSRNRYELDALSYGVLNDKKSFLMLGAGAGGVHRVFSELSLKDSSLLGVELDPMAIQISKDWFGVKQSPSVRMLDGDARVFLAATPAKYDYVMIDLFAGESLPVHCLTYEFFRLLYSRMADDGVFFFNTNLPQHTQFKGSGYNALGHVVASIMKAGFRSVFINDQQDQGLLYVFKDDIQLPALLEKILKYASNTDNPEAIRVSLLANYFSLQTVPEEWGHLESYSDDLTPEPLIYSYFIQDWKSQVPLVDSREEDANAALRRALVRFAKNENSRISSEEYARAILDWTTANPGADVRSILAAAMCRTVSTYLLEEGKSYNSPATRRLLSYLRGSDRETSAKDAIREFYAAM